MKNFTRTAAAVAFAAALLAPAAHAGIDMGLKAGLSTSKLTANFGDTKWNSGGAAGVSLAFELSPGFAVAPELLYVRKGATLTSTNITIGGTTYGSVETGMDLDYLELPILLRFTPATGGPLDVFVTGGPSVSVKVNEKFRTRGLLGLSFNSDQAENLDYGLLAGGGVKLGTGSAKLTVEGRWEWGLANISKLPFGGDVKNSGFVALAGIEFPLLGR